MSIPQCGTKYFGAQICLPQEYAVRFQVKQGLYLQSDNARSLCGWYWCSSGAAENRGFIVPSTFFVPLNCTLTPGSIKLPSKTLTLFYFPLGYMNTGCQQNLVLVYESNKTQNLMLVSWCIDYSLFYYLLCLPACLSVYHCMPGS